MKAEIVGHVFWFWAGLLMMTSVRLPFFAGRAVVFQNIRRHHTLISFLFGGQTVRNAEKIALHTKQLDFCHRNLSITQSRIDLLNELLGRSFIKVPIEYRDDFRIAEHRVRHHSRVLWRFANVCCARRCNGIIVTIYEPAFAIL